MNHFSNLIIDRETISVKFLHIGSFFRIRDHNTTLQTMPNEFRSIFNQLDEVQFYL